MLLLKLRRIGVGRRHKGSERVAENGCLVLVVEAGCKINTLLDEELQ